MKSLLRTDVGRVRKRNEDAAFIGKGLYLLCDGMGGHQGGNVAAGLAVDTLAKALTGKAPSVMDLQQAIALANQTIFETAREDAALRGMGTTLTALWTDAELALLAQIGDSRAYLLRGGLLRQLTHDHSLVAELVRAGQITPDQARLHPQRNLVTRALGTEPRVEADIFEVNRHPGDRWLLCSDGLSDLVTDAELARILKGTPIDEAADTLLDTALGRGGPDNVTLLIIDDEGGGSV